MELKSFFEGYERLKPGKRTMLRTTSLALRRNGIDTMEKLISLYEKNPGVLGSFRDIGPGRLRLIGTLVRDYEVMRKNRGPEMDEGSQS